MTPSSARQRKTVRLSLSADVVEAFERHCTRPEEAMSHYVDRFLRKRLERERMLPQHPRYSRQPVWRGERLFI